MNANVVQINKSQTRSVMRKGKFIYKFKFMDHYGSRAVDTCGLYILWHCLMVSTAFLSYLLL